jgi:hypothetical protein
VLNPLLEVRVRVGIHHRPRHHVFDGMLIGQLAFWAGVFGLVCQLAALGLSTWQKAPGGVTMGLWQECQAGGCSDSASSPLYCRCNIDCHVVFLSPTVSSDGMSVRQYNTLWVTRVILCLSVCICFGALFCASKVVSDTGTRRHVKVGKWLFFAAGAFLRGFPSAVFALVVTL